MAALCVNLAWAAPRPLRVMLTNDDGFDAAGLTAVRAALEKAGYAVTVVAPLTQQSGSGVRITLGEIAVADHGHDTWSVDGSPADCASYGLSRLMAGNQPDVVVSGANLGQNLGANAVSSGTVGAAVMAAELGVPAIAVSVGLDMAEAKTKPMPFASTVAAYPLAGEVVARLIGRLVSQAHGGPLLPAATVLNVNVPARPAAAIHGVRVVPLGRHGGFRMIYAERPGQARMLSTIEVDRAGVEDSAADTGWFARDYITVSVLRPDWNAAPADSARLVSALGVLETLRPAP
jgi:5'/3'-nucleotidase SurE